MFWIGVSGIFSAAENVTVMCKPDFANAEFLAAGKATPLFSLSAGQNVTFATELEPGQAAFCWMAEANGTTLNHTDLELVLGVDAPPDLLSNVNYCHSDNFFLDDEVCFAYGNPSERSVVYSTVQSDLGATGLTLTCDLAQQIGLGYASATFNLAEDSFQSFVFEVPATTKRLLCTADAPNGDIDLYVKVGKGLTEWDFDFVETSDVSIETCSLSINSYGSSTFVFVIVYGYSATTDAILSCVDAGDDSLVTTSRENPDLD